MIIIIIIIKKNFRYYRARLSFEKSNNNEDNIFPLLRFENNEFNFKFIKKKEFMRHFAFVYKDISFV